MGHKLFYMAVVGWGAAVVIHSFTLVGVDVAFFVPFLGLLHVGVFAVWLPAVLKMRRAKVLHQKKAIAGQPTHWDHVYKQAPDWLRIVAVASMTYALLNLTSFSTPSKSTGEENGHYYTHNREKERQPISAQAYHHLQANNMRRYSGNWLAFYGMAMAILYTFKKLEVKAHV
jgi:hypothetical protein